jgi:hypothetical protein
MKRLLIALCTAGLIGLLAHVAMGDPWSHNDLPVFAVISIIVWLVSWTEDY